MSLPETGEVEVVDAAGTAELVEEVAEGAGERLLIVLDIDGTVLLEDETLSPGVVEAVEDAGEAGHEVMIATGRSWAGTEKTLQALNIRPEYVVCSNGAVVMKREGAEYVRAHTETFDPTLVLSLLREHLPHAKYMVELEDGERLYTDFIDDWNLSSAQRVPFQPSESPTATPVRSTICTAPFERVPRL